MTSEPGVAPAAAGADGRAVLPIVFAVTLSGITIISLIAPSIPDITRDLGLSDLQAGLIVAGASMPGILLAPVIGIFADRYGRKHILVACLVVFGLAGGMCAFTTTFAQLFSLRVVQGLGAAGLINLAVVILGDTFTGTERAKWIGINATVLTIGLSLNPQIGGLLATGGNWRRAFLPYFLALGVAAWAGLRLHDPTREKVEVRSYLAGAARHATTSRAIWLFASGAIVFVLIFGVVLFLFVFRLDEKFGLSPGLIGLFLGAGAVVAGVVSAMSGRLHARFRARFLVVAGFFALAVGYALMGLGNSLVFMGIAVPFFAVGEGLSIPTMQNLSTELGPAEYRGGLVALFTSSVRLGQTIGPILAGVALAAYGATWAIAAAGAVAGAWGITLLIARK